MPTDEYRYECRSARLTVLARMTNKERAPASEEVSGNDATTTTVPGASDE